MVETFYGYIETTQDVLLVFEACRRGLLPRVCRRLQEKERKMIKSGSVFVFDERESGIKRWTDGLVWSPSRILGNFLIYRELDKRVPGDKKLSISSTSSNNNDARQRSYSVDQSASSVNITDRNRERRLVGSLSDSYRFRKDGLIKKTMSIIINGVHHHLISYYLPNDIIENKLRTPSSVPELASLEISPDLLVKQNFRVPPLVEPSFDQTTATYDDRRMHPFRSMSMGSLRTTANNNQPAPPQIMYTNSFYNNNKATTSFYNNTNGFPPLPSPSSITSSPNTPMLSPVRQSFTQSNRNYSISSTSSGSMRYTSRPSFDMSSLDNRVHPHMIPPEMNNTSPNIGQLLNPVHPLKQEDNFYSYDNNDTNNTIQDNSKAHMYGGNNYYIQKPQQQQQNTQPNVIPMFRNNSMSMYDDTQNGPELGMEPLMLK